MKSDERYVLELSKTLRMLDDNISQAQRAELRLISSQTVESLSRSLTQVADSIKSMKKPLIINEVAQYQLSQMARINLPSYISNQKLIEVAQAQLQTFAAVQTFAYSDMLNSMKSALMSLDWSSYCDVLAKTLQRPFIDAPDFSYLRLSELALETAKEISLPRGMSTALGKLSISSSYRLAKCEDISYEVGSRHFVDERRPNNKANAGEMNIIFSAVDLFDDCGDEIISEKELLNFMNVLQVNPGFASEDSTGKKIITVVNRLVNRIDFDANQYYHARVRCSDEWPYTYDQMLTAPSGVTGPGRYNHPGQAYYYFSNTRDGAVSEVMKHIKETEMKIVQIAVIAPKRSIQMIDLSCQIKRGLTFLKYIRYPAKDPVPKAYLIPCFVSDCCRVLGIEGLNIMVQKTTVIMCAGKPGILG